MDDEQGKAEIRTAVQGRVAIVTIDRPPHNHVTVELLGALADALDAASENGEVRSVLLRSAGKTFCAGADFSGAMKRKDNAEAALNPIYQQAARLFSSPLPVVASIEGAAVGAGLGLAVAADFRVASRQARFCANFVKLGLSPGFALTQTLPDLIGAQRARLMMMTGRRITAEQALEWGLVDILAETGVADELALTLATEIADNAPLAVRAVQRQMRPWLDGGIAEVMTAEDADQRRLRATADFKEGVAAVAGRRPALFRGA